MLSPGFGLRLRRIVRYGLFLKGCCRLTDLRTRGVAVALARFKADVADQFERAGVLAGIAEAVNLEVDDGVEAFERGPSVRDSSQLLLPYRLATAHIGMNRAPSRTPRLSSMEYGTFMEDIARGFEVVGVAIILIGGSYGLVAAAFERKKGRDVFYDAARTGFGHSLLLGLEILVAADIIETVVVHRSLENVASLGILVLIRVVLSISLDIEIDGMVPWRRALFESRLTQQETSQD